MLTPEENELLTRVGPGTPMGGMMRRYWMPACLSSEIPEPDCDPVRVRLLSEDLVAFRDSQGRVGMMVERCPHRGSSLFFGRNEKAGLRCLYHGWKFDVEGRVLDTPCEPPGSTFKDRLRHVAYPTHEQGEVIWTYMGPGEAPPFPSFEWTVVPNANRVIAKVENDCNYLQGVEGVVDSSHVDILHSGLALMREETYIPPTYEVEDTPWGFRYSATRMPPFRVIGRDNDLAVHNQDGTKYVRTSCFVAPIHTLVPPSNHGHMMIFVPIDDEHNWNYSIYYSRDREVDRADMAERRRSAVGPDLNTDGTKVRTIKNNYLQDRAAMRANKHWSGIAANPNQDAAMTESMGSIYDRSAEHLGYSDLAVQHMRRVMLDAVRRFMRGEDPIGSDPSIQHERIESHAMVMPADAPWTKVHEYGW